MKLNLQLFSLLLVTSMSMFAQQKTLLNKDGERIRGTAIAVGKAVSSSNAFSNDPANWELIKSKNLNTVRVAWIGPWYEQRGFTDNYWGVESQELKDIYDTAVANAKASGMTIIINYHNVGEQQPNIMENGNLIPNRDFTIIKRFWEIMAARYKDETHVIYEITNEPLFNHALYTDPAYKVPFLEIYNQVRNDAPEREVIMFSFNGIHQNMEGVVNEYANDIDWTKTSVGYHMYQGDFGQKVRNIAKQYRVICTEFDYDNKLNNQGNELDYVFSVDGYKENSETMELYQHSWVDWSAWSDNSLNSIDSFLIPDATAKGYQWWDVTPDPNNHKIVLRAKGTSGNEVIKVLVNDTEVASFDLTTTLDNFTATTTLTGEVKVEFTNPATGNAVRVDYMAFDGEIKDAENQFVNTGVAVNGACTNNGSLSETLDCAGFINFKTFGTTPPDRTYNITIGALGRVGTENLQLLVNGILVKEWVLAKSEKYGRNNIVDSDYETLTAITNLNGPIRLLYNNDNASGGDARVGYITVDDSRYEAEAMPTNTGNWTNGVNGASGFCGAGFSEFIQCGGYIQFPSTVDSENASLSVFSPVKKNNTLSIYPIPAKDFIFIEGVKANTFTVYNTSGITVKVFEATKDGKFDISDLATGIYFIKSDLGSTSKIVKE